MEHPFWSEDCPARGPALSHTKHRVWPGKCRHCGLVAAPTVAPESMPVQVKRLAAPDPMTGCVLDHTTLDVKRLIADGGIVWTTCPFCGYMVEPGMRTGDVIGPVYGPGRGDLTDRLRSRLLAWVGWSDFNGGS